MSVGGQARQFTFSVDGMVEAEVALFSWKNFSDARMSVSLMNVPQVLTYMVNA